MSKRILVIGGGQAAASFVAKLRALDQDSQVTIFSEESFPPYQRPPLSKKYLLGDMTVERLFLRPESWYQENKIELLKNTHALSIDRDQKCVKTTNGTYYYDKLFLATGSRPRHLPETMTLRAPNIHAVRSIIDVDGLKAEFQKGRRLVVIGGGYIGLEAAAVARKFEIEVTVIEASSRILGRVASTKTADFFRKLHQNHGVEIIEGQSIEHFHFDQHGHVNAVQFEDGRKIETDFVITGIGILTNSELAENAGIHCEFGINVDEYARTSDPNIFAAGDVTSFIYRGQRIRLESVQNAVDQAEIAAQNIASQLISVQNRDAPMTKYQPAPWFWSDQYDVTLQIAGLNLGYDDVILRQNASTNTISVWYYQGDQLISVDAMGEPRTYMIAKRVIESGKNIPKEIAADPAQDLMLFMRSSQI